MENDIKLVDKICKECGIEFNDNGPVDSFEVIGEDGSYITINDNFNIFNLPLNME